ncbi:MAG: hypothetical protein JXQ82_09520 [Methanomicrobiaceae archaeon]|nr:hypothetical protein [Methanomicrobiaceae archaeon]
MKNVNRFSTEPKFTINKEEVLFVPSTIIKPDYLESRELINPFFLSVLNEYKNNEVEGFPLWNNDCHDWKWVCPPDWRELKVHYEFCDYDNEIGVEIHLEDLEIKSMQKLLESLKSDLSKKHPDWETDWEPDWSEGVRLGVLFPKKMTNPDVIVGAMQDIIEETSERIWGEIERISS